MKYKVGCVLLPSLLSFCASFSSPNNINKNSIKPPTPTFLNHKKRPIQKVVVVGGTHGNEYTGVWCIKALSRHAAKISSQYPSLTIETLLANPEAHYENKRFIHSDLNREFSQDKLLGEEGLPLTVERLRAQEVNELLGPKFGENHPSTDVIVDLHTTTTNMGICLIVPEGDVEMIKAAAYVSHKVCGGVNEGECRILVHSILDRNERPNLGSIARHGFTVEVGPVPQGVLRHDAVEKTEKVIHYFLEYLEKQNKNEQNINTLLEEWYPEGQLTIFKAAKACEEGQLCGRIRWPSDPENPNFPQFLVHKSLQDRDFHKIQKGDALFVDLDGNVINYSGSHGEEVYLIFVNEGGYYYSSSGTGLGVAVKRKIGIEDGMIRRYYEKKSITP
uniref:Aspartoacylase n=1 Tax=Helicotheca tamesis TaxID=374047 RepID=A0A7S2MVI1_9STRA